MGHTLDSVGRPTYTPSPTQTVADLQAAVEYVDAAGGLLKGLSTARGTLTLGSGRAGWVYVETDTSIAYLWTGSQWVTAFGRYPMFQMYPSGTALRNGAGNVTNWQNPGNVTGWYSYNSETGDITCLRAGKYQVSARMAIAPVASQAINASIVRNGSDVDALALDTVQTHGTYRTVVKLFVASINLVANDRVRLYVNGTTAELTLGGGGGAAGEFNVRYLGPV